MKQHETSNKLLDYDKHQDALLYLAKIHRHLRNMDNIWHEILSGLLLANKHDLSYIANELQVSLKTVQRILHKQTKKPTIETSFRILMLYLQYARDLNKQW